MTKKSLSFQDELYQDVEQEAAADGITPSAAFSEGARLWLMQRRGLRAVRQWEADNGALSEAELADADTILDGAGVSSC